MLAQLVVFGAAKGDTSLKDFLAFAGRDIHQHNTLTVPRPKLSVISPAFDAGSFRVPNVRL